LLDADFVRTLVARHRSGEAREANKLFALLVFQLWREKNLDA
jgi:hypothetical protein